MKHGWSGSGYRLLGSGDSDGVVPVSSAQIFGVDSQKLLKAKYGQIHRTDEGTQELLCILRNHLHECGHNRRHEDRQDEAFDDADE